MEEYAPRSCGSLSLAGTAALSLAAGLAALALRGSGFSPCLRRLAEAMASFEFFSRFLRSSGTRRASASNSSAYSSSSSVGRRDKHLGQSTTTFPFTAEKTCSQSKHERTSFSKTWLVVELAVVLVPAELADPGREDLAESKREELAESGRDAPAATSPAIALA